MSKILWINPFSGISGDMLLGALLDVGVSDHYITAELNRYGIDGFELKHIQLINNGIMTSQAKITIYNAKDHYNSDQLLSVVKSIKNNRVREIAVKAIEQILIAESKIHSIDKQILELHELGELDTLIDIVGVAIAIDFLKIDKVFSQPIGLGMGIINTQHGVLPSTAPITMKLLESSPVLMTKIEGETITPTGATLIRALDATFDLSSSIKILKMGYGSGTKKFANSANFLQIAIAEETESGDTNFLCVLETNLDDVSGEILGYIIKKALDDDAIDCWVTNGVGKKGRPTNILHLVCEWSKVNHFQTMIFSETGSLGIRKHSVERVALKRSFASVSINGQIIRIKQGPWQSKPEYDDLVNASKILNLPILSISKMALEMYSKQQDR
jgi:uncharacterized protein (TIGR00299 family) protein